MSPIQHLHLGIWSFSEQAMGMTRGICIQLASIKFGRRGPAGAGLWSLRGCSSAGRAPDLHSGGRRFDPDQLHQKWAGNGPVAQMARAHP